MAKNNFDSKKLVEEMTKSVLKRELKKWAEAGRRAAKEIRSNVIMSWFGEYRYHSVLAAEKHLPYTMMMGNNMAQIIINSYVDLDAYKDKPKAQKWVSKYGGKWDAKYYVLSHLQMTEGIIGLPARSVAHPEHGWVNRHFIKRSVGLRDAIFEAPDWAQWDIMVNKFHV